VRCLRASSDHKLNVSISVAAQTPARVVSARRGIQPACAMLLPRLPTYITASSSSSSSALDMQTRPSVDPESRSRSRSGDREKCKAVMSSEWVDVCFLSGAAGCRGSLESHRVFRSGLCLDGAGQQSLTHQYRISASSCRSSVPAATVRPSEDTSQEKRALCPPSNGTAGRHGSLLSCRNVLVFPEYAKVPRTLDRCGIRAVIPHTHDAILS
jgi:hypothetical protein